MRILPIVSLVLLAAGCKVMPAPPRTAARHAANVAAAQAAGYRVITAADRTIFCPTAPQTGSHIGSMCVSESEWEAQVGTPPSPSVHVTVTNPSTGPGPGH